MGKETGPGGLSIKTYWTRFDKANSDRFFKAASLCQAVKYATELQTGDAVVGYQVVTDAVIKLLRLASVAVAADGQSIPINRTGLKQLLRRCGQKLTFGEWLAEIMMGSFPDETA